MRERNKASKVRITKVAYMSRGLAVLSENRDSKYFGDSSDFGELSFSIEISPTTGSDALAQRISALERLNLIPRFTVP